MNGNEPSKSVTTPRASEGVTEGVASSRIPTTPQSRRLATLFHRRHTTSWSDSEVKAYRALGTIDEDDLGAIERYYATERDKKDEGIHRRDLATFLNNFAGELDRARAFEASGKTQQIPDRLKGFRMV